MLFINKQHISTSRKGEIMDFNQEWENEKRRQEELGIKYEHVQKEEEFLPNGMSKTAFFEALKKRKIGGKEMMRENIKVEIDVGEVRAEQERRQFKKLLGFYLGSMLHEDWKIDDEVAYLKAKASDDPKKSKAWELSEDGTLRKFKSVDGKVDGVEYTDASYVFEEGNPAYRVNERQVDIRALTFDRLPLVWQKENADAGKTAIDLIFDRVLNGEKIDIEEMAAQVHEAWLSRPNNSWVKESQKEESKPYQELSEPVKAKDRKHIELALELLNRVKTGEITYEGLREKVNPSMQTFNNKLNAIQEQQK